MSETINISPNPYRFFALLVTLVLIAAMCSCSASWHIKKAKEKDPSLFMDTIRVEQIDTFMVEVPQVDTLLKQIRDTLIEYKSGGVQIKYLWNTKTDSIYIEADCPDTEVVTKLVTKQLPPIVLEPTLWQQIKWFAAFIAVIIVLFTLKRLTK